MKVLRVVSCMLAFFFVIPQCVVFAYDGTKMNITSIKNDEGIVGVRVDTDSDKRLRIGIHAAASENEYFFSYAKEEGEIDVPLIFGNDIYSVNLFEELSNKYYTLLDSYDVDLQMNDYDSIYLSSSVIVPWSGAEKTVAKAAALTKNEKNDVDKFFALYDYVTENTIYDMQKTVETGYRSSPDEILADGKGICLDIAVLLASMLRSTGIKCKLVYGQASEIEGLHSWNEVYLKNKWIIVDPTKDAILYDSSTPYKYYKHPEDYKGMYYF